MPRVNEVKPRIFEVSDIASGEGVNSTSQRRCSNHGITLGNGTTSETTLREYHRIVHCGRFVERHDSFGERGFEQRSDSLRQLRLPTPIRQESYSIEQFSSCHRGDEQ